MRRLNIRHFTPGLFTFLRELDASNNKEWWEQNKDRYVAIVREPSLRFIDDFSERLHKISPHFVAEARTVGGSLMRPYRDIRFSADKTPYKTNVGIQFRHDAGKDVHAPGFYLHLEPGGCFTGVGLWHPEAATADRIRRAIAANSDEWERVTASDAFTSRWAIRVDHDDSLKRVPRGLDPEHPHADVLRMKSFMAMQRLSQADITRSGFDERLSAGYSDAGPFAAFLCTATGVPF